MKHKTSFIIICLILSLFLGSCVAIVDATDIDFAQQYAPILYFEKDETCYPVNVSYHIENSDLYQFTSNETILINNSPTVEEIGGYSTNDYRYFYLDNQKGSIDDNGIINDYQNKMDLLGYTVYSHVTSSGGKTVVQYWMFYAFNKGSLNIHEGDWEMVQVILSSGQPTEVMYSQHMSGQKATWGQVDREGNHVKVYVGQGTHANYLRSYSGQIGVASDIVGDNGKVLQPNDYNLELLESQNWLNFSGRWGAYSSIEDEIRGKVGPFGPRYREDGAMWNNPIVWGNSLPQANDIIFLFEWFFYNFVMLFLLFTAVSLLVFIFRIYLRHKRYGLGPRILSMLYIDGLNMKSIGNIVCIFGIIIAIFGLFHQWYGVSIDINVPDYGTTGLVDMIVIDGINGVQINLLDPSGSLTQLGSFSIPFSLLVGIGLVFLIIGTTGISKSKKLGKKYIFRGIRLAVVIIAVLIAIMSLGFLGGINGLDQTDDVGASEIFSALSSQPFGGATTIPLEVEGVDSASLYLKWGLGIGGQMLLIAGLVIIIAGIMQFAANTTFFEERQFEKPKKGKGKKSKEKFEEPEIDKIENSKEE